ncbi:MAG: prohibitin family protein [Candidatus Altiarchaeota archaeon]
MRIQIPPEGARDPIDVTPPRRPKRPTPENALKAFLGAVGGVGVIAAIFILIAFYPLFIASIGAGEVGVKFNYIYGGVEADEFGEGWHLKAPWVSVTNYNIKTTEYTMSLIADEGQINRDDRITAISKDGLNVDFDVTILYHIIPEKASIIHQTVGPGYQAIVIRPVTRTSIRDVAGEYVAMDMHQKRPEIADNILMKLQPSFLEKNIVLEQVLVRTIVRPPQIERAIESKLQAEQEAQKMEFVIQKEEKEAERKEIEAGGISTANRIIGESLTPSYLSWYWIENLDSHESVIYVPVSDQGFPMFKDIDKTETKLTGSAPIPPQM